MGEISEMQWEKAIPKDQSQNHFKKRFSRQGKKVRLLLAEVVDNLIWTYALRVASIYDIIEALLLFERNKNAFTINRSCDRLAISKNAPQLFGLPSGGLPVYVATISKSGRC
mgnify:CR=1 FL=1